MAIGQNLHVSIGSGESDSKCRRNQVRCATKIVSSHTAEPHHETRRISSIPTTRLSSSFRPQTNRYHPTQQLIRPTATLPTFPSYPHDAPRLNVAKNDGSVKYPHTSFPFKTASLLTCIQLQRRSNLRWRPLIRTIDPSHRRGARRALQPRPQEAEFRGGTAPGTRI